MNHAVQIVWKHPTCQKRIATVVERFRSGEDAERYAVACRNLRFQGGKVVTFGEDLEWAIDPEEVVVWDDTLDIQVGCDVAVRWLKTYDFDRGTATVFERRARAAL